MIPPIRFEFFSNKKTSMSKDQKIEKKVKTYQVVVFDGDKTHNWVDIFDDKTTLKDGSKLRIIQTSWYDSDIVVYPDGAMLQMSPVVESEGKFSKPKSLIVKPDFVIIRNQARLDFLFFFFFYI